MEFAAEQEDLLLVDRATTYSPPPPGLASAQQDTLVDLVALEAEEALDEGLQKGEEKEEEEEAEEEVQPTEKEEQVKIPLTFRSPGGPARRIEITVPRHRSPPTIGTVRQELRRQHPGLFGPGATANVRTTTTTLLAGDVEEGDERLDVGGAWAERLLWLMRVVLAFLALLAAGACLIELLARLAMPEPVDSLLDTWMLGLGALAFMQVLAPFLWIGLFAGRAE